MELQDEVAVVTGSAGGIGRAGRDVVGARERCRREMRRVQESFEHDGAPGRAG